MCRLVLVVGWLLVAAGAAVFGERPASFHLLEAQVTAGQVHTVRVVGGLERGSRGYARVAVHWREGAFGYWTEVLQARPRSAAPLDAELQGPVISRTAGEVLSERAPRGAPLRVLHGPTSGVETNWFGWRVPNRVGWLALGLAFGTLGLLVNGPAPWRASRWAWFWLMTLASPLGLAAFLVLSGPVPALPAPREGARRLTGGFGFLLAVVLAAVFELNN